MTNEVTISRPARKQLRRAPAFVVDKLLAWVESVETDGLAKTRRIPGFHDEPLKGPRQGQRSIRLSRSYRAVYTLSCSDVVELVTVEEVHKHDY